MRKRMNQKQEQGKKKVERKVREGIDFLRKTMGKKKVGVKEWTQVLETQCSNTCDLRNEQSCW